MKIHGTEIVLDCKTQNMFASVQISNMYEKFITLILIMFILFFQELWLINGLTKYDVQQGTFNNNC